MNKEPLLVEGINPSAPAHPDLRDAEPNGLFCIKLMMLRSSLEILMRSNF